jgi:hypothetical protein
MEWYQYIAAFFSGAFLGNAVPHFVKGICGDKFPTPFAKPPGKGLSSPTVNMAWALFNMVVGYLLLKSGQVNSANVPGLVVSFIGVAAIGFMSAVNVQGKHKE